MSRCFPFPPPDYVWIIGGESLFELLELRRLGLLTRRKQREKDKKTWKKDEGKSSNESKCRMEKSERYKIKKSEANYQTRNNTSKRRKREAPLGWLDSGSRISEELGRLNSCNHIWNTGHEDRKQLLFNWFTSSELCFSPSESTESATLQSQPKIWDPIMNWVPPQTDKEYRDTDDLNWLMNSGSDVKMRFHKETQTIRDDISATDRSPLYPSISPNTPV